MEKDSPSASIRKAVPEEPPVHLKHPRSKPLEGARMGVGSCKHTLVANRVANRSVSHAL